METIKKENNTYFLRLDPGDEFISSVRDFCIENKINSGWLEAIGSTKDLELAYFNLDKKDYDTTDFAEFLEILTISGNIALKDEKPFVHAHGLFGRADMSTIGGHVNRCVISATCEVMLHAGEDKMRREFDDETNLHLLK
ncbi:MAG: PPC domain-containing DNA-binding protein [Candidatus Spechtbacterales bacterium]|nr:PPC domain-containing DNA-binding protein [Candidatus Spechtbacterales bacterium]